MPYKHSLGHRTGKTVKVTNFSSNTVRGTSPLFFFKTFTADPVEGCWSTTPPPSPLIIDFDFFLFLCLF